MNLHPAGSDIVEWIEELQFEGSLFNVYFKSGSYVGEDTGYRVTIDGALLEPSQRCRLERALNLSYAIAQALGIGPGNVKDVSGPTNSRFILNYYDTDADLYDVIEFFSDTVQYVNEGGPQLAELENWQPSATEPTRIITTATVTEVDTLKPPTGFKIT